jgi:AraC-like DNA-binding protein
VWENPENLIIRPNRGCAAMDRLEALLVSVGIGPVEAQAVDGPCFWLRVTEAGHEIGLGQLCPAEVVLAASLEWPTGAPLLQGGPIVRVLGQGDPLFGLTEMLRDETAQPRCGARSLLGSYVEGLMVHLLRNAVETHDAGVGLLAGLAEPRLARALVAIHARPAQLWTAQDLAEVAGMSRSSFMDRFRSVVGQTPMTYLRGWRMGQAQAELLRGARVAEVARRYGYQNADAFARAYHGQFGQRPSVTRRA